MKQIFILLTVAVTLANNVSFAQEPIINQNVTIQQNTTAAQCPSSWRGAGVPVGVTENTAAGVITGDTTAAVRSCTGCAFDTANNACVCKTCYDYYN